MSARRFIVAAPIAAIALAIGIFSSASAGCAAVSEVRLAPGSRVVIDQSSVVAAAEPVRLKINAGVHSIRIEHDGRASVEATIEVGVPADRQAYWHDTLEKSAWNRRVVSDSGEPVMAFARLVPNHEVLFEDPLARLAPAGSPPFLAPETGEGLIIVSSSFQDALLLDGAAGPTFTAAVAIPDAQRDWGVVSQLWTAPLVVPCAPGKHRVEVSGNQTLSIDVSVKAGVYTYLCAKNVRRLSGGGGSWGR